jgi:hypothetical protein
VASLNIVVAQASKLGVMSVSRASFLAAAARAASATEFDSEFSSVLGVVEEG